MSFRQNYNVKDFINIEVELKVKVEAKVEKILFTHSKPIPPNSRTHFLWSVRHHRAFGVRNLPLMMRRQAIGLLISFLTSALISIFLHLSILLLNLRTNRGFSSVG